MIKIGVLFLGRKRLGFDPEWGKQIASKVKDYLRASQYETFIPSLVIVDDSSLRSAIAECKDAGIDVMVVLQPTISEGNLAASLSHLWDYPPVLWATPVKQEGSMISSNSLVGTHIFASTLRQLQHPFELVYGMPGAVGFEELLDTAVRLTYAVRRMKNAKAGLIGYHCPGYINVEADSPQLKTRLGIQLYHFALNELIDTMEVLSDEKISEDVDRTMSLGLPLEDVTVEQLDVASRYYLAMKQLMKRESLDALAVRCWPELPNLTGQWPYLAFVRMLTEGIAVGCEGDIDGAISCLMGNLLGFGPGYLSDWLEHDSQTITLWHTGNSTLGFLEPIGSEYGPRITRHFNNKKPVVVEGRIKAGVPITVFRLWRCDDSYHLMAFEGETILPKRHLMGTNGLARVHNLDVNELFDQLCHAGMPHHVAVFAGRHSKVLSRFSRLMGINWVGTY